MKIRRELKKFGGKSSTVGHVNSLRGACLVQGVLSAVALSQEWSSIKITEAHPKALKRIWSDSEKYVSKHQLHLKEQHEEDAAIAAYAAKSYSEKSAGWVDWFLREKSPFIPSGTEIAYWFPEAHVHV